MSNKKKEFVWNIMQMCCKKNKWEEQEKEKTNVPENYAML